jgi:RHS repeat-associated protein
VTTSYVDEGPQFLEERPSAGSVKRYVYGLGIDQPLAQVVAGTTTYNVSDHLGSIVRTTDTTGNPTLTREYDPWGNPLQGAGTSGYAFTGREWDSEIQGYYYRARYYDPKIGRFISEDPIQWAGGNNFYAYVENNPVNYVDPGGLKGVPRPPIRTRPRQPIPPRAVDDPTSRPKPTGTWKGQPTYLPDWLNEYLDEIVDEMERARCTPGHTPPDDRCKLAKIKCIDECTWAVGGARWNQGTPFRTCVDRCMKREGC